MELSAKNTKAEILDAYEVLLKKVQSNKSEDTKTQIEENRKKESLEKVLNLNDAKIEKEIISLKNEMNSSLDNLLKNMRDEIRKLEEVRIAIDIEKKSLEDLYALSASVDSLETILLVQKEKKESFEKEMRLQTEQWEIEKSKQKNSEKEYNDELIKKRKREEEEYQYNIKIDRKKEQDEYDERKALLEKELIDKKVLFEQEISHRETEIKNAETELSELRKNSVEFPAKLKRELENKEKEITEQLKNQYDFNIKLIEKQNEADIRLKDQIITSLQDKISELQIQVKEYSDKANKAEAGVKEIAVKAIENSNKVQMISKETKE